MTLSCQSCEQPSTLNDNGLCDDCARLVCQSCGWVAEYLDDNGELCPECAQQRAEDHQLDMRDAFD